MRRIFYSIKTGVLNRMVRVFGIILMFSVFSKTDGNAYASDYTDQAPTKMTAAVWDMEAEYNHAAGRTLPGYTEWRAGDVTGRAVTPGLYHWGTRVRVSADGVTVSGSASDAGIFSGAAVKGIMFFQTKIAMNKGATLHSILSFLKRENDII